jgi:hypothetical protein
MTSLRRVEVPFIRTRAPYNVDIIRHQIKETEVLMALASETDGITTQPAAQSALRDLQLDYKHFCNQDPFGMQPQALGDAIVARLKEWLAESIAYHKGLKQLKARSVL